MSEVVTLADLKAYLGITSVTYDIVLQDIIDTTEAQLKSRYGIAFADTPIVNGLYDYHKTIDNYEMDIGFKPINLSFTFTIEINEAGPEGTPSWKTLTRRTATVAGDFSLDEVVGKVRFIDIDLGYDDFRNVRLNYTYGWPVGTVPIEVEQIILLMSAQGALSGRMGVNLYTSQDSVRIGELSVSKGGNAFITAQQTLQNQIDGFMASLGWITPEGSVMV